MWSPTSRARVRAPLTLIRAAKVSRLVVGALVFGLTAAAPPRASAQDDLTAENCSTIVKDIKAETGGTVNVTIQGADCTGPSGAKLRVTYFWLDDVATGHVLAGYMPPALGQALGRNYPVVRNDVYDTVKILFDRFGEALDVPESEEATVSLCFDTGARDELGYPRVECGSEGATDYIRERRQSPVAGRGMKRLPSMDFFTPLLEDEEVIARTDRWPDGYGFHYDIDLNAEDIRYAQAAGDPIAMPIFTLWRAATPADLQNLQSRVRTYARRYIDDEMSSIGISGYPEYNRPTAQSERRSMAADFVNQTAREIAGARLLDFLARDDPSMTLAYVYGSSNSCTGGWQFRVAGPSIKVLVGVIENAGETPLTLSEIAVLKAARTGLRLLPGGTSAEDESWSEEIIPLPQQTFRTGEGVLVPMRIEFRAEGLEFLTGSTGEAYGAISALALETPLVWGLSDFSKPASSFGPHAEIPAPSRFAYGPEIRLKQARLGAQQVALRQVDPTAVSLFVGFEIGSCPYVYGYDRTGGEWRLQSRAVVGATRPELAYEDRFALEHFDGRLRIAEIEPEVSFLDDVTVEVTLADGSTLSLAPDDARLRARDSSYLIIAYPAAATIRFPGFDEIGQPIVEASVRIFGYYREFGVRPDTVASQPAGPMCRRGPAALRVAAGQPAPARRNPVASR